jgi:hypothetical protein
MNCLSIVSAAALFFPFTNIPASQTTDSAGVSNYIDHG